MSQKPFLENTKVFLFLHVTRERVPELNAPVKGAVQYFSLTSESLSSFCILSAKPDSTTKSM